jgi:hypothetical protein
MRENNRARKQRNKEKIQLIVNIFVRKQDRVAVKDTFTIIHPSHPVHIEPIRPYKRPREAENITKFP